MNQAKGIQQQLKTQSRARTHRAIASPPKQIVQILPKHPNVRKPLGDDIGAVINEPLVKVTEDAIPLTSITESSVLKPSAVPEGMPDSVSAGVSLVEPASTSRKNSNMNLSTKVADPVVNSTHIDSIVESVPDVPQVPDIPDL